MNRLSFSDLLLLKHTVNSCHHFKSHYITQSRSTQRAGIDKRFGVLIPPATFDRSIRRAKGWSFIHKVQRSGQVNGRGQNWKSSVTSITWALVMFMWRLGELTREKFEALKRIFGMAKERGPAKLRATPTPQLVTGARSGDRPSLFPT